MTMDVRVARDGIVRDLILLTHTFGLLRQTASRALSHRRAARVMGQGFIEVAHESRRAVQDDTTLVHCISQRDHEAFAALYDRHAGLVYGICNRILHNPSQAEDVTQQVFTTLWSRPSAFAGGNFGAWLSRVARNAALDVLRSAAVRTREPELHDDLPAHSDLEETVFSRLRSQAVVDALMQLPASERNAIEQAYFGGLSYREVAEQMGEPLGTIKSRIRSGLRRLGLSLQNQVRA